MELRRESSTFEIGFDIGAVSLGECGDLDPSLRLELLTTSNKKFGSFQVTSFDRPTAFEHEDFKGFDTSLFFRSNHVNGFFSETIINPLAGFLREMLAVRPVNLLPEYFKQVWICLLLFSKIFLFRKFIDPQQLVVDSVQEYLPLNEESLDYEDSVDDEQPPLKGKQKSLVHFDVVFGGFSHETAFPV